MTNDNAPILNTPKGPSKAVIAKVGEIMHAVSQARHSPPELYDAWYREVQASLYEAYMLIETLTASLEDRALDVIMPYTLDTIFAQLRPPVVVREKIITTGLPDGEDEIVRECFEDTVKSLNLPLKRQGYSYRSPFTDHGWSMVFGTVNRIRNRILADLKAKEKEDQGNEQPPKADLQG